MSFKKILLGVISGLLLTGASYADSQFKFGELTTLADKYGTDKGSNGYHDKFGGHGHHYTEVYEYFFYPLKYSAKKVFEIGVESGASEKMFRDYFPNAIIYGVDIVDESKLDSDRIKTFIADQSKRKQLKAFLDKYGAGYDILLDDGGHTMDQQQISFGYLLPYVRSGGLYVIEDVHTSFNPDDGALPDGSNTTYTMITNYIKTAKISSKYMTQAEQDYLSANIEYCNLFSRDGGKSITCIFKKK
jgi:hypothetical protein